MFAYLLAFSSGQVFAIGSDNSGSFTLYGQLLGDIRVDMAPPTIMPSEPFRFSGDPRDDEFMKFRLFAEPLLPMGGHTSPAENKAFAAAVTTFAQNPSSDNMEQLEKFLSDYPNSAWRVSLLTNMGILYRDGGYWVEAFSSWEKAWQLGKMETEPMRKLIVDQALGSAADLALKISWVDYLKMLLEQAKGRDLHGPASELISNARAGLYLMQKDETKTARCGPLAVRRILASIDRVKASSNELKEPVPNELGTTFVQLRQFTHELGLNYQMAFRAAGSKVIVPSVVNWKVGHHAALTQQVNGRYIVEDVTFGRKFAISERAIDRESSGYFLIPQGKLPAGWRSVEPSEGEKVWGKGWVEPTTPPPPPDPDKRECKKMADYSIDFTRIGLQLSDTPVYYTPPHGPAIEFTADYNQRDVPFSAVPNYPNLGPKWNCRWICFILDDPNNQTTQSYGPGGGQLSYSGFSGDRFALEPRTKSILIRTSSASYKRTFPDGSWQVFELADNSVPKRIFMTESYDSVGNKISYQYDSTNFRLLSVTDSLGKVTAIAYASDDSSNSGFYRIKQVTDPFLRKATFDYTSDGHLQKITDMGGISSEFTYGSDDFISKLTTPYGDTKFESTQVDKDRTLVITDPIGKQECAQYKYSQIPPDWGPVPDGMNNTTNYFDARNTFYWNKKAYAEAPGNYNAATIMHWLHTADWSATSDVLDSVKPPCENRIFYSYLGQDSPLLTGTSNQPSIIGRVLDDGSAQLTQYEYNSIGKLTKSVTPGDANTPSRTTTYRYANNEIDLLAVYQENPNGQSVDGYGQPADLLQSFIYDTQGKHLIMSSTDASGQTTRFTYNAFGQVLTVTNPKGEATTFTYDRDQDNDGLTDGYLIGITGPVAGATTTFQYDSMYRLWKKTDSEGYTVTTEYEAIGGDPLKTFNRPVKITYPDQNSTTVEIIYNKLDAEWIKDRMGRWTHSLYNADRQVEVVIDPLNRITQYGWCACGALESVTDPLGNTTTFLRDLQSRVSTKVYPDNKSVGYVYDGTGRLKTVSDAKGQVAQYQYYIDNSLRQVDYTDASGNPLNPATPSVSYTYDSIYPRVLTYTDGIGTTQNTYNLITATGNLGAGKLSTITGPWAAVSYTYDQLGRLATRSITGDTNGTANHTIYGYDSLGRTTGITNPLGSFGYTYVRATGMVETGTNPNGQGTVYSYYDNTGDQRLQKIKHLNPSGNIISQFDYTYNPVGEILSWAQSNSGLSNARQYAFGYDSADQMKSAQLQDMGTNAVLSDLAYGYDAAVNRTTVQENGAVSTETPNTLNQLIQKAGGGTMRFAGKLSKPARVSIGGGPAVLHGDNSFEGYASVSSSTSTRVHIVATDANGNTNDKYVDVPPNAAPAKAYIYDDNGNMTAGGTAGAPETAYTWDAANRLTSIIKSGTTTRFDYDGAGRRVREWTNDVETKRWIWDGLELSEERDSNNAVTKRYYSQGMQVTIGSNSGSYYYTRDHLGSVREMVDSAGAVRARYDYDIWGNRSGNLIATTPVDAEFGFTGHYYHTASGLYLAPFRAYDPLAGRWISRDPLGEAGGLNLYGYVNNSPANYVDPNGKSPLGIAAAVAVGGAVISQGSVQIQKAMLPQSEIDAASASNQAAMAHLQDVIDSGGDTQIYDGSVERGGTMGANMGGNCGQKARNLFESMRNLMGYPSAANELAARLATGIIGDNDDNATPGQRVEMAKAMLNRQQAFQRFLGK